MKATSNWGKLRSILDDIAKQKTCDELDDEDRDNICLTGSPLGLSS